MHVEHVFRGLLGDDEGGYDDQAKWNDRRDYASALLWIDEAVTGGPLGCLGGFGEMIII